MNCLIGRKLKLVTWDFTEKETKCPSSGEEITQLVFGVYKSDSYKKACSHLITMETWHSGLMLPVKATIDGLKDKDKKRDVRVFVTMAVQSVVFFTQQISTVEVGLFNEQNLKFLMNWTYDVQLKLETRSI